MSVPHSEDSMPPSVDLSLAVNYIPIVECLMKMVVLMSLVAMLCPGEHLGGYVLIGIVVVVDRVLKVPRIIDGNALMCCVVASLFVNYIRVGIPPTVPSVYHVMVAVWLIISFGMIMEPTFLKAYMQEHTILRRVVPVIASGMGVGCSAFVHMPADNGGMLFVRVFTFLIYSFGWVYFIGVWRTKRAGGVYSHSVVVRFLPILFVYFSVALSFYVISTGCLIYQYIQTHAPKAAKVAGKVVERQPSASQSQCEQALLVVVDLQDVCHASSVSYGGDAGKPMSTICEEEEEDLEASFRAACQSRMGYSPVADGVGKE